MWASLRSTVDWGFVNNRDGRHARQVTVPATKVDLELVFGEVSFGRDRGLES
jgi:hypothetical protein